jgi:hypothetical protein
MLNFGTHRRKVSFLTFALFNFWRKIMSKVIKTTGSDVESDNVSVENL